MSEPIDIIASPPPSTFVNEDRHKLERQKSILPFKNPSGNEDSNQRNKETKLRGAEYLTKLKQLLPSVFDEFEQGDLER